MSQCSQYSFFHEEGRGGRAGAAGWTAGAEIGAASGACCAFPGSNFPSGPRARPAVRPGFGAASGAASAGAAGVPVWPRTRHGTTASPAVRSTCAASARQGPLGRRGSWHAVQPLRRGRCAGARAQPEVVRDLRRSLPSVAVARYRDRRASWRAVAGQGSGSQISLRRRNHGMNGGL